MIVLTDNILHSDIYFKSKLNRFENLGNPTIYKLEEYFFPGKEIQFFDYETDFWNLALVNEFSENSQFDTLLKIASMGIEIPDNTLCLAGSGNNFHGFRNRQWESRSGNIHLSCYFRPNAEASKIGLGFTILSAVSVIDTLDKIPGLENRAMIKWVNDIIIGGSKISGVIAQTQIRGNKITDAVVGIGLNVAVVPDIEPTSYVPKATSLNSHLSGVQDIGFVTNLLLDNIKKNYLILLNDGIKPLLEKYISRSVIIGREVQVWSDPMDSIPELQREGRVESIGEYLELYLENQSEAVTNGRITLK